MGVPRPPAPHGKLAAPLALHLRPWLSLSAVPMHLSSGGTLSHREGNGGAVPARPPRTPASGVQGIRLRWWGAGRTSGRAEPPGPATAPSPSRTRWRGRGRFWAVREWRLPTAPTAPSRLAPILSSLLWLSPHSRPCSARPRCTPGCCSGTQGPGPGHPHEQKVVALCSAQPCPTSCWRHPLLFLALPTPHPWTQRAVGVQAPPRVPEAETRAGQGGRQPPTRGPLTLGLVRPCSARCVPGQTPGVSLCHPQWGSRLSPEVRAAA